MKANSVSTVDLPELSLGAASTAPANEGQGFDKALQAASREYSAPNLLSEARPIEQPGGELRSEVPPNSASTPTPEAVKPSPPNGAKVAAAYQQAMLKAGTPNGASAAPAGNSTSAAPAAVSAAPAQMSDFEKYRDDQLLRNPGGRNYYLDQKKVVENSPDQESFLGRVGKTLSAVAGNIKNLAGNMFLGAKFLYRAENNEIREAKTRGFLGTVGSFFKDMAAALSFGAFHPDEAEAPKGFAKRMIYSACKLKDAVVGDFVEGLPSSLNHMGNNLVLAGWHLAQVLPDATIGNFDAGRKLTTSIFDNGHVMVEYLTDIMPTGDAWLRVHAMNIMELQPPLLYNIKMPEHYTGDTRWQYVRNTPFRKSIETIGSLLADVAGMYLLGQTAFSSDKHHPIE